MFKRTVAIWSSLLICCAILVYFQFIAVREKDLAAYQDLMQESLDIKSKHALEKEPGKQIRFLVQKDIWTGEDQKKSHIRMISENSELIISQQGRSLEAHETFRNMKGSMQKEADASLIYRIEAMEGFYRFPSDELVANKVKIFTEDHFYLEADRAEIVTADQPLQLEGNIRLRSSSWLDKETYALADKAIYHPKERLFILLGSAEKNVLCWQDGASFAATEIHIQQNMKTVEGVGDVRFSFSLEEKYYFESIFSRYM